ncbi:MAG: Uma2 family endonuclease [Tepidisphaeraceae bacterium]
MPLPPPPKRYTVAEYLALEEKSLEKHEFHDGEIVAMAGEDPDHALITNNVGGSLIAALRGGPCRAYSADLRISIKSQRRIAYADNSVICGPLESDPDIGRPLAALNPRIVAEVLSRSTRGYDLGEKFQLYLNIPTFDTYVLIEQEEPYVQVRSRQPNGDWLISFARGMDAVARLPSLGLSIPLTEIYAGVTFTPTA